MSPFSNSSPHDPSSGPSSRSGTDNPISDSITEADANAQKTARQGAGCLFFFSLLFGIIGAVLFFSLFLRPVGRVIAARNWVAVPCQITSSVISPHSDSDGTTYSADIVYAYSYANQNYTSGTYSFGNPVQGNYRGRQSLLSNYPVGGLTTCYVDPSNPGDAVLNRGLSREVWTGLFSLFFLAFGLIGMVSAVRIGRVDSNPKSNWRLPSAAVEGENSLVLRPTTSPLAKFLGLGFMAVFWNGITGYGTYSMLFQSGGGIFVVFGALFFLPFLLIGVGLLVGWVYTGLAMGNARPKVTLSKIPLRPGQSAPLQFELRGGLFWPRSVEVTLEGREEATFTRGTDTITDKSTFFFQVLPTSGTVQNGTCTISIPAGAMHSLESKHNKIVWMLKLRGAISRWPDIQEEWKIPVEPAR